MLFTKSNVLEGLGSAEVCGVRQAAGLQVFGLKWPSVNGHDYLTLDEALEQQALEVTEVDAGGRVPTLKVANKSGRMVFLMAGEELGGGKQNRVLNASMMVPAKGDLPVPGARVDRPSGGYECHTGRSGT